MLKSIHITALLLLAAFTVTVSAHVPVPVPDAGSSALLLGGAALALGALRKKFGK